MIEWVNYQNISCKNICSTVEFDFNFFSDSISVTFIYQCSPTPCVQIKRTNSYRASIGKKVVFLSSISSIFFFHSPAIFLSERERERKKDVLIRRKIFLQTFVILLFNPWTNRNAKGKREITVQYLFVFFSRNDWFLPLNQAHFPFLVSHIL